MDKPSSTLEDVVQTLGKGALEQILPDAIYLTEEAARIARVQPTTILHAIRTGKIRAQGRPYRIRGSELFKLS